MSTALLAIKRLSTETKLLMCTVYKEKSAAYVTATSEIKCVLSTRKQFYIQPVINCKINSKKMLSIMKITRGYHGSVSLSKSGTTVTRAT